MLEQSLKIVRTAAAVGSFTEAAALSGMTQPNVTKQIANLERELDVKLFLRTGCSVQLTPAGEILRDECERLFALEADVLRKVRSARQGRRPYLIGGTATAGSFLLIGMAAIYQKKHPDCHLHLKIERPDALHRMLASGEIVLALTDAPYDHAYFLSEPYCTDRLVPVFAPGYRKRRTFSLGNYIRGGGKFVLDETMWGAQSPLRRFLREHRLPEPDPADVTEVCSLDAVKTLVQAGAGVSVVSDLAVENELKAGVLQTGRFAEGDIFRRVDFICTASGDQRFIHDFIAFARRHKGRSLMANP